MSQANRTLVLLAGLTAAAIGIGLYAYLGVQQPDVEKAKVKDRNERLFNPLKLDERAKDGGLPKTEFVRVTVTFKDETTTLTREPGKEWQITDPVQTPADRLAIDQVVSQLQAAKFKQVIEEKPDDAALAKYGLKPPQFVVTAEAQVGENGEKRAFRLEGGIENTFDGTVYLRRDGDPQVWSAEGGVRWALQKSTFDFREKSVFGLNESQVTKLEVKSKENEYTLEREAQKNWQLTKPIQSPADQATVTAAFGALRQDRALSFPADTAEARKNFAAPLVDATFTLEGGSTVRIRFAKVGTQIWMLREEGSQAVIAEFPVSSSGQLNRNPNDLKNRLVLNFKKEQVAKIVFHPVTGKELVVERPLSADGGLGETWIVTAPSAGTAKTFKVAAVLWTLGALKASGLGEDNPKDWGKYGLDAKGRSVTLVGHDGKELARLVIGKEVLGKTATAYLRGTRNQVIEGDNSRLTELPAVVEDLLELPGDAGSR